MDQFGVLVDEAGERVGLESGAVVGDDRNGPQLAGLLDGDRLEERSSEQLLGLVECDLDGRDRVVVVLGRAACQPISSLLQ